MVNFMFDKTTIESMLKLYLEETEYEYDIQERLLELTEIISSKIFVDAVKICVENNRCDTLFLQKSLSISFHKAVAIINSMEALKLVEPLHITGNSNRKMLPGAKSFIS